MARLTFKLLKKEAKRRNLTIEPIGKRAFAIWEGCNESGVAADCENLTEAWGEIYNWENQLAEDIRMQDAFDKQKPDIIAFAQKAYADDSNNDVEVFDDAEVTQAGDAGFWVTARVYVPLDAIKRQEQPSV